MNAIIKKGEEYFAKIQIQDDVIDIGPFRSEERARHEWSVVCKFYNGWGDPIDVDIYELVDGKDTLIKLKNRYKNGNCKCKCNCIER
jgi:hypothetical protein